MMINPARLNAQRGMHQTGQVVLAEVLVWLNLLRLLPKDQVDHKDQDFSLKTLEFFLGGALHSVPQSFSLFLYYLYIYLVLVVFLGERLKNQLVETDH